MTDDFDSRVRQLLNEHVDSRVGPPRPAPAFDPNRRTVSRPPAKRVRTRWLPPLLAAACIAVLVGGVTVTTSVLASDRSPAGPATPAPPPVTKVTLGAASVALPKGWVARNITDYLGPGSSPIAPGWCLTPASLPASTTEARACPVTLYRPPLSEDRKLDPDIEGGFATNPNPCGFQERGVTAQYGNRTLGGRAADWRHWQHRCRNGSSVYFEQYVVPTAPAWILDAEATTDRYHDAMTTIATRSTLPAQTDPLRWVDRGYVRSVKPNGATVTVTIDRASRHYGTIGARNLGTATYAVPAGRWRNVVPRASVGSLVEITTDGRRVTSVH